MKQVYLLLICFVFAVTGVEGQRSKEVPAVSSGSGIVYSLPRSGVRIFVKATRERFYAGPYQQYAEVMLGIRNAPASDRENWSIEAIRIETFSEPDPDQVYRSRGTGGILLSLTSSGTLAGINSKPESGEESLAVSTFLGNTKLPEIPFPDLSMNSFFIKPDSGTQRTFVVKSLEQKAMEAADAIVELRERRFDALSNYADEPLPDGQSYETLAKELNKLEENYLGLFVGKTIRESYDYCFDYIPGAQSVSGDVVFRFNEAKGVLPSTDMSGRPIMIEMKKQDNLAAAQAKQAAETSGGSGVFYRVPGKAEIRILNGINLMAATRADIAQFGTVIPVPDALLDGYHRVTFHPQTGAIKSVFLSSETDNIPQK